NVGARADANGGHVAANHRARPDAAILADDHVADDDRGGIDIRRSRYLRMLAAIGPDVRLSSQSCPYSYQITSRYHPRCTTDKEVYSSSRLVTLCLSPMKFPTGDEFQRSEVGERLVRAHAVVGVFPMAQLVIEP